MNTQEQWRRLKEFSFYPMRRPARECTEELGAPQKEEEYGEVPEMEEGQQIGI